MNAFDRFYRETMRHVLGTPEWSRYLRALALWHWAQLTLWLLEKLVRLCESLQHHHTRTWEYLKSMKGK
jgi:hypothetical protein